jgi:hypothetical protein
MPTSIKITDVRDVPTVSPKGELTTDVLVTYVVDGQRVYQTRVPKGKSDLPSVQAVIQKEELERQKLVNQEFKIG